MNYKIKIRSSFKESYLSDWIWSANKSLFKFNNELMYSITMQRTPSNRYVVFNKHYRNNIGKYRISSCAVNTVTGKQDAFVPNHPLWYIRKDTRSHHELMKIVLEISNE